MDESVFLLLFVATGLAGAFGLLRAIANQRVPREQASGLGYLQHRKVIESAAERLGLECAFDRNVSTLVGFVEQLPVSVTCTRIASKGAHYRIEISVDAAEAGIPEGLKIWRAPAAGNVGFGTGDSAFDAAFVVSGREAPVLAALEAPARHALLLLPGDVSLSGNHLRLEAQRAPSFIEGSVRKLVECAQRLGFDAPAPRLLHHVRNDPEPGFRARALTVLARDFGDLEETVVAVEEALADRDPRVRLSAATALGSKGHATLIEILADPWTPSSIRLKAAARLEPGDAEAERALARLLARAAFGWRWKAATDEQRGSLRRSSDFMTDPTDFAWVTLESFVSVATSLGRVGASMAAIRALERCVRRVSTPDCVDACEQAIIRVRMRLGAPQDGQLSLVPEPAQGGALSQVEGEAGRMSYPPDGADLGSGTEG